MRYGGWWARVGEFCMPSLGTDMVVGTLVAWKVKSGDTVHRGDIVAEVETDKGLVEVEIFEDGVIDALVVPEKTKVPVGTVLAVVRSNGAPPASPQVGAEPVTAPSDVTADEKRSTTTSPLDAGAAAAPRLRASPSARKLADELGMDLAAVHGTGPHGAIGREDVERTAAMLRERPALAPTEAVARPGGVTAAPASQAEAASDAMRRAIAAAMSRSNRDIPHYYVQTDIDMRAALTWLAAENLKRSVRDRLLPTVLLIKAVAGALTEVPELNGFWIEDRLVVAEGIHLGVAISLRQGGLVVPAIHNADMKSVDELMQSLSDLIRRVRAGRLRASELSDATMTMTHLGDLGVETVFGVIYPPQVGLAGFGRIVERPWAECGMLGVRPVVTATLAGDHRATDGRRGAQFLDAVRRRLQAPEQL